MIVEYILEKNVHFLSKYHSISIKVVAVVVAVVLGKVTSKDLKLKGFNKVRQQGELKWASQLQPPG